MKIHLEDMNIKDYKHKINRHIQIFKDRSMVRKIIIQFSLNLIVDLENNKERKYIISTATNLIMCKAIKKIILLPVLQ